MNIITQAMQEVLLGFKPKPDLLENLTPPIPATSPEELLRFAAWVQDFYAQ